MFDHLHISNPRERFVVGVADIVLSGLGRFLAPRASRVTVPRRILLLRLERIGDLLMALAAIRDVRRHAPDAQIDLVVGSWNADLAKTIKEVDHVETLDVPWMARRDRGVSWAGLLSRAREWRKRDYDLGINFEGDIRSNLLLGISAASRRLGFPMRGGGAVLTSSVEFSETDHTASNVRRLVRVAFADDLGRWGADEQHDVGRLTSSEKARSEADDLLRTRGASGMLIGIQASAGRQIKQWDPTRFAQAGTALAREYGATLVVTGTESERPVTQRVIEALAEGVPVVDLTTDLDLPTLGAVLERLSLFLTCDTGPMHLAAAVGTPIVAVFGPSLPSRFAPLSSRSRVVRVDLPCSPCNQLRRPPARCVGHIPDCLVGVEVSQVITAARELLGPGPGMPRRDHGGDPSSGKGPAEPLRHSDD